MADADPVVSERLKAELAQSRCTVAPRPEPVVAPETDPEVTPEVGPPDETAPPDEAVEG